MRVWAAFELPRFEGDILTESEFGTNLPWTDSQLSRVVLFIGILFTTYVFGSTFKFALKSRDEFCGD